MKHPKQNYGVFHKEPTVVNGQIHQNAIFTAPNRQGCVDWVKGDKSLTIRKLNKQEMERSN